MVYRRCKKWLRALYPALLDPKPIDMVVYMHHCFPPFPLRMSFLMFYIFLRITDVLFDLIVDIQRQDGVDNGSRLSQLELFLNNDCHIPFKFSVCKETKNCNGVILWGLRSWSCLTKSI